MCLITEQKEPFIAEEDIVIWKSVDLTDNKIRPLYRYWCDLVYKLGKCHKTKMIADNIGKSYFDQQVAIHYGIHDGIALIRSRMSEFTNVHEGFHSFLSPDRSDDINIKGIIPKGALYYTDATGLVVSNKIILQELL